MPKSPSQKALNVAKHVASRKGYANEGAVVDDGKIVNVAPSLGLIDRLMGKEQPVSYGRAKLDQSWPSEADLATARKYDQTYGNPVAPTLTEGAQINRPSFAQTQKTFYKDAPLSAPQTIDPDQRDRLETAWLAANKTALGSLGFDPRRIASTPDTGKDTTLGGFYGPKDDQVWYSERYPSAVIHESIHRGINKLREANKLPDWFKKPDEERFICGMMLKHFGDIEVMPDAKAGNEQINDAKQLMDTNGFYGGSFMRNRGKSFPDMLTELESLAANHLHEQRPRGPRANGGRTSKDTQMAKSKSQQATNLAKQYTADQLAAAMIYGETRAGVDAKGNMSDQLAGVRELRTADNRARATGKDISGILTQPKQFQGLNPQSLQAITNPDSLKNPGDRAAARAALDKAKDYFAGKYEGQVGKGTPYENVTSFNQASEAYNTKKSGAVPGSHVAGGDHNFFTTADMAKRLQQAQATQQASQPGGVTTETANVATPTAVITPQGTAVAAPKGEISAGQSIQGSNVIERNLGPMGQKEDESSDYGGRGPAFAGTGEFTPLYKVPPLDPYKGTTLGAGNVAGIPQYPYSSQNKSVGQGTGQGQGQGTGQGGGSSGGASSGSSGGAGASGLPSGYGDGTVAGGGYGSSGDGAGQGAGQGAGAGMGDGTIAGSEYGFGSGSSLPPPPRQQEEEQQQQQQQEQEQSGGILGALLGGIPDDYGSQYGGLPGAGGQNMGQSGAPAYNPQTGTGTAPGAGDTGPTQMWGNQELGPSGEEQGPPPPGAGLNPETINPAAPEQTPTPNVPEGYTVDTQPTNELPPVWLTPDTDAVAQNGGAGTQYAELDTGIASDASNYAPPQDYYTPPPPQPDYYEPPPSYDVPTYEPPSYSYEQPSFDYYTPWTPDSNSGVDTSSYYTPSYEAPSYSYEMPSYSYDPGPSYDYSSSSGGGGFDMSTFDAGFARGGGVGTCVTEAMKRTRKYARGGSVAKNARMVLSKKAESLR